MSRPKRLTPNGNFYLMMRSPADLVRMGEPVHVKRSLGTKDEAEAKVRHAELLVRLNREWSAKRNGPQPISHRQIVALAGEVYTQFMETASEEPGSPEMWDHVVRIGETAIADPVAAERWYGPAADRVLATEGLLPDATSRTRLLEETHRAVMLGARQKKRQAEGDYGPKPRVQVPIRAPPCPALGPGFGLLVLGLTLPEQFNLKVVGRAGRVRVVSFHVVEILVVIVVVKVRPADPRERPRRSTRRATTTTRTGLSTWPLTATGRAMGWTRRARAPLVLVDGQNEHWLS